MKRYLTLIFLFITAVIYCQSAGKNGIMADSGRHEVIAGITNSASSEGTDNSENKVIKNKPVPSVEADINKAESFKAERDTCNIPDSSAGIKNAVMTIVKDNGAKSWENEIDNIILNETITKIGKDFYDLFYKNWTSPPNGSAIVVIEEKPMPGMGTRISIKVNDYYVFQRVLQPRYEIIKDAAIIGVNTVSSFISNYEEIQKNLQGEDLKGTGVY